MVNHIDLPEGYVGNMTDDQEKGLKEMWQKVRKSVYFFLLQFLS